MILCPFDDIAIGMGLCALAFWIRNQYRKMRGKPPILRRCKHGQTKVKDNHTV